MAEGWKEKWEKIIEKKKGKVKKRQTKERINVGKEGKKRNERQYKNESEKERNN